jgi:hypothetical protein
MIRLQLFALSRLAVGVDIRIRKWGKPMIAAIALLSAALFQPVGYTTWWNTGGAKVIQISEQNLCALYVSQQKSSVGFLWDRTALAGIVFQDDGWDFPPRKTEAAVRVGSTWISDSTEPDWFEASESKDAIAVTLRYFPVESLLSNAGSVSLRRDGGDLDIPLDRTKMPKLLQAVTTCRQHLK